MAKNRILIVDDDARLREAITDTLMLSGYELFYNNTDVYSRGADDSLYTLLCKLNGFSYVQCSNYNSSGSGCKNPLTARFNETSPLKHSGVFKKNGYSP